MEAVNHLKVRSCLIDGEVVCCDERGLAVFHVLHQRHSEATAFLYAFDLLELDGADMRREPIESARKRWPASCARHVTEYALTSTWSTPMAGRVPPCLQDGARRDRVEAAGIGDPFGPLARLARVQQPSLRGSPAGGGGALELTDLLLRRARELTGRRWCRRLTTPSARTDWSSAVLFKATRFPNEAPWQWSLVYGFSRGPHAHPWLRADPRGGYAGIRQKLA